MGNAPKKEIIKEKENNNESKTDSTRIEPNIEPNIDPNVLDIKKKNISKEERKRMKVFSSKFFKGLEDLKAESDFEKLPKVLFSHIFSYLEIEDVIKMFQLNKFLLKSMNEKNNSSNLIWKGCLERLEKEKIEEIEIDSILEEIDLNPFECYLNKYYLGLKYSKTVKFEDYNRDNFEIERIKYNTYRVRKIKGMEWSTNIIATMPKQFKTIYAKCVIEKIGVREVHANIMSGVMNVNSFGKDKPYLYSTQEGIFIHSGITNYSTSFGIKYDNTPSVFRYAKEGDTLLIKIDKERDILTFTDQNGKVKDFSSCLPKISSPFAFVFMIAPKDTQFSVHFY